MQAGTAQINANGAKLLLTTDGCPSGIPSLPPSPYVLSLLSPLSFSNSFVGCNGFQYKGSGLDSTNVYGLGWFNVTAMTSPAEDVIFFFYWYSTPTGTRYFIYFYLFSSPLIFSSPSTEMGIK
jgi:hypothetical protein